MKARIRDCIFTAAAFCVAASTCLSDYSYALSLDSFNYGTTYSSLDVDPNNRTNSVIQSGNGAFGGTRSVEIELTSPRGSADNGFFEGMIFHNSGATAAAISSITYDGDNTVGLSDFDGLQLDLTEGNADSLLFAVSYDFPGNPMTVEFTFYDRSDTSGNTYSRGTFDVDQRYSPNPGDPFTEFSLAFSDLRSFGSGGAADLTNIGAFSVVFDSRNAPAADFGFSNFRTNGSTEIPEPGTLILLGSALFGAGFRRQKQVN